MVGVAGDVYKVPVSPPHHHKVVSGLAVSCPNNDRLLWGGNRLILIDWVK